MRLDDDALRAEFVRGEDSWIRLFQSAAPLRHD